MNDELSTALPGRDLSTAPKSALADRALTWLTGPVGRTTMDALVAMDSRTLDEQIALTQIPAPPFGEGPRGARMAALMVESGLHDVESDPEGNVIGYRPGQDPEAPPIILAAHLDTVFPHGTEISVVREGDLLRAPGICDDGRGLTALLAIARAMDAAQVVTGRPLLFAATVGEEGLGDLRGVRHLFSDEGVGRAAAGFISLDGAGDSRVVSHGLGSVRFRIRVRGPGGHSWVDWGLGNPIHLLAEIVAAAAGLPLPDGVTLSTGRISGGKSVNAIPEEAWAELEIRGRHPEPLAQLRTSLMRLIDTLTDRANRARLNGDPLSVDAVIIGDRPAGKTPDSDPLVEAAMAVTRAMGRRAELALSSTDANLPMSLGIPAITLGAGGQAGQAHTLDEWYQNTKGPDGIARALAIAVLYDQLLAEVSAD